MTTQHNGGSAAGDMTMAEQQEVLTMQEAELQGVDYAEAELQGVMPAKIADAVLVVVS